jgi:putative N6-adenine-specific DNA methylase
MSVSMFLPSARSAPEAPTHGAPTLLARECEAILGRRQGIQADRGGVRVQGDAVDAMKLNLHSRLAQRVLWPLIEGAYGDANDLYALAARVPWGDWIAPDQTLRVDTTAQRSPLESLNFATLRIKDAVCDRVREATGARPSVDTHDPHLALALHLTATHATLYADTSGAPLFKRGWRRSRDDEDVHGEAPLKETLAAQLIATSGWGAGTPFLDPCCGAGTLAIEAAQVACGIAPGASRHFAFEKLKPWRDHLTTWHGLREQARAAVHAPLAPIHASDVSRRMVDIAHANAQRAGVAHAVAFTVADATTRPAPQGDALGGCIVTNPPFGARIDARGAARGDNAAFAELLAANWKRGYAGWVAWLLCADPDFERALRLRAGARVPVWNGAIECRLLRFDLVAGSARERDRSGA